MSDQGGEDTDVYAALARRVEDADQDEVWQAFGREMDERAREGADDHQFAGFRLVLSRHRVGEDVPLGAIIHVDYRQFGGSRLGLKENGVAEESDVYAVMETDMRNPVEVARRAVVLALREASDN